MSVSTFLKTCFHSARSMFGLCESCNSNSRVGMLLSTPDMSVFNDMGVAARRRGRRIWRLYYSVVEEEEEEQKKDNNK